MATSSKEHILSEIRRVAAENGDVLPGQKRFTELTGIGAWEWKGRYWARWGDAVREAGHEPQTWGPKGQKDDQTLLRFLADLTRTLGHIPTEPDLRLWKRSHPDAPHATVFRTRWGGKAELVAALSSFARAEPDYADVAAISATASPRPATTKPSAPDEVVTGVVYLLRMGEFFKIGKSNDPGRRLYEIGLHLPEKHDLVHVIETDDPSGIEAYWHRRFAAQRANGEWFRLAPADVAAFQRRAYQ